MTKTLLLMFHRDIEKSVANAALFRAAQGIEGVTAIDMQARYPDGHIDMFTDAAADAQLLLGADRIVLQFPVQWYATPSILKAWQDAVLTRMYYMFPKDEGARLAGTPLMLAATLGNVAEAYTRSGQNHYSVDEIFIPLKAMAHRCGLPWHAPHLTFSADKLDDAALAAAAQSYTRALQAFIATPRVAQTAEV
ncbi:NAD(P)H-dependent oxidoreductase [Sulfitobacter geojensis]|uniref:NAD(P)H-dependent oxidoreductase n=1 Tax=Sulfitobacter geojensis TaxID=1342299 RepID=A0AAE2W1C2_9RHOB|nr:NAD(P)H-dependent oxidoreductase [Sulfitobacter geojensis]MBM1690633.1 NAD(P)H-dependent oxidoreductase [Sulfitobacter geojensis]MBM1694699.1 NAD(P)H-dependent oxidoreductase [Sulfitobacter geojensis]MBM1707595.1 NAD(P)H-dependent oxidoreductase [Sulfitobacter geojensis]MBM1711205.1 NAD(P)H-dependent oxidoreductase [Sulfitobacter geojensis]MBM1715720.1 NAD(P)H-dependent oxidoreductase [Sulfitobacter geojensis]